MFADLQRRELDHRAWGYKISRLSIAVRGGFRVPPAICMTSDEVVAAITLGRAIGSWLDLIRPTRVVVRSSSRFEDGIDFARAGWSRSVLDCTPEAGAISRVLTDLNRASDRQMAYLVQQQIDAQIGGVAFFDGETLTAEVCETTNGVTSGRAPLATIEVAGGHLKARLSEPTLPITALTTTLYTTSQGLRHLFGFDVDCEWAYVRGTLSVLQVRPVTRALDG